MRAYIGITDGDWYRQLWASGATEVNFWQPRGGRRFGVLEQGAPFLFKTHYRDVVSNRIVGYGFFDGWASLTVSRAWEFFGKNNGCNSFEEMRDRIVRYRRTPQVGNEPEIGCIMLRDVSFLPPREAPPAPPDWPKSAVQGKSYELVSGSYVADLLRDLLLRGSEFRPTVVAGDVFGEPALRPVRVGQAAFKALVQEAYGRRCAITGDKVVPVLQAAHIKPVTQAGENRVDNGLLIRSDVHTLFDRGYLGVHPQRLTVIVSPRLRSEWGNGEEFYRRAATGVPITVPTRTADRPQREFLQWHADTVFHST